MCEPAAGQTLTICPSTQARPDHPTATLNADDPVAMTTAQPQMP